MGHAFSSLLYSPLLCIPKDHGHFCTLVFFDLVLVAFDSMIPK
jgi:hypothetical protein